MTGFSERYRRLFNRRGSDWWSIVFGYPVARLAVLLVLPLRWITPTGITCAGLATKIAAGWFLAQPGSEWQAALLLQVAQVLDSMDGTLARERGQHSVLGAYLDKLFDAVTLFALTAVVGWRGLIATGEPSLLLWATGGGGAFVIGCYLRWLLRSLKPADPDAAEALDGSAPVLSWRELAREWLRGWSRVVRFQEADLYLWVALAAVLNQWQLCCYMLGVSQGLKLIAVATYYGVSLTGPPLRR